jgi:hypothetical protein
VNSFSSSALPLQSESVAERQVARQTAWWAASRLQLLVLGAVAAAVSLALSGYQFGIINNQFHLPIVAALYDEPQFGSDPFIQSLRHYSSGVWMLLQGSARYVAPYWLFLGLDYLSRLLSFVGFLCCGGLLGISTGRQRVVFVVVLCFSSLLHGYSYPGNGGLFINYFSQSEVANGTILLAIYFAARGRLTEALALVGVTFFINAFMAVWTLPPLLLIVASLLRRGDLRWRALVARGAVGLALAAVIASPVLWNIVTNPEFGHASSVSFRTFLLNYYPDHILFMQASPRHMLALAIAILYGFACLALLPERAASLRAALCGSVLLYAVGIVLPFLTDRPLVLNLHLIRSSAVINLLVATASAALVARWVCDSDRNKSRVFGPLLVVADCTWRSVIPLGLVAVTVAEVVRCRGWAGRLTRLDVAAALLLVVIWPRLAWQDITTNHEISTRVERWQAVGDWARTATPATAVFLIPTELLPGESRPPAATTDPSALNPADGTEIFEFASHRQVWVDVRRGAAVMWTPSYYDRWWQRTTEVLALRGFADKLGYARANGIDYVVDACRSAAGAGHAAAFEADGLCVYPASTSTPP